MPEPEPETAPAPTSDLVELAQQLAEAQAMVAALKAQIRELVAA